MTNYKRFKVMALSIAVMLFIHVPVSSAQTKKNGGSITGKIVDKQNNPVSSAMISIANTSIGTYSNELGAFRLEHIPVGKQLLVVSGIGISKKTLNIVISNNINTIPPIMVDNALELSEITVEGKTAARKQQEQAFAITALDLKISYNTSTSLNKLLNTIPSVRIREDGGLGSNYNFSLNGFSGNQIKFFLDGIPMDHFGTSFNLSDISVNMAERIDVYKGVLPVSLGGDALGGAVNIITRKDANYLDASYSIGSFNTHRVSLNGAYTNLKTGFTVRANTFYNYSDNNYKVYAPVVDLNTSNIMGEQWVKRFHDTYQSGGIRIETGIINKPYADYLLVGFIASKNNNDVQTGATMDAVYGGVTTSSRSLIPSIRYKKDNLFTDGLSLSLYGAYSAVNTYNTDTLARVYNWLGEWVTKASKGESFYTDSKITNREYLGHANLSYMLTDHQSLTLNHVFSSLDRTIFDKVDPNNESNKIPQTLTKNITGLGWQINQNRWNLNVFGKHYGTRSHTYKLVDQYTADEHLEQVSDKKSYYGYGAAGTYYVLPKFQIKLSYEQAYRLPESTEMFGDGLIQQRNPNLKPESSKNLNLGLMYDKRINSHLFSFETNFFYRNTKDFILKAVSLTSNPTTGYENLGKVLTQGLEAGVHYRWQNLMHAGIGITYQNIIDNQQYETNSDSFVGEGVIEHITYKDRLPNIPFLFGHGNLGFQFKDLGMKHTLFTIDYSCNYVAKYYLSFPGLGAQASKKVIPEQLSHDVSVGYTLANGKYSLVLDCTNITNEKLYDNYRLQKPGRAFNLKLRYFLK